MSVRVNISGSLLAALIDESLNNYSKCICYLNGVVQLQTKKLVTDQQEDKNIVDTSITISEYICLPSYIENDFINFESNQLNNYIGIAVLRKYGYLYPSFQDISIALEVLKKRDSSNDLNNVIILIIKVPTNDSKSWVQGINYSCFTFNAQTMHPTSIFVTIPSLAIDAMIDYTNNCNLHNSVDFNGKFDELSQNSKSQNEKLSLLTDDFMNDIMNQLATIESLESEIFELENIIEI